MFNGLSGYVIVGTVGLNSEGKEGVLIENGRSMVAYGPLGVFMEAEGFLTLCPVFSRMSR